MCFTIKYKGKKPKVLVAAEDMIAYKVLSKVIFTERGAMDSGHEFKSFYYDTAYPPLTIVRPTYLAQTWRKDNVVHSFNKSARIIKSSIPGTKLFTVDEGIHLYKTKERAEQFIKDVDTERFSKQKLLKIFTFVIPKGTKYYENDDTYVALKAMRLEQD